MAWKSAFKERRRSKGYSTHLRSQTSYSRPTLKASLLHKLGLYSFLGVVAVLILFFIALPIFAVNLPSPDKLIERTGASTKILDRNGVLLYDIFENQQRTPIKIEDVPLTLKQATIATEDKNFYKHQGFDFLGTVRGLSKQFTKGRAEGGSTLTQQLVKNSVLMSSERTPLRKFNEFILSIEIEKKYNKDQILQMYLNETPYGGTAVGIGAASDIYFGKSVKDINLLESAILAGLPQRPTAYSPYGVDPKAYISRTTYVLRRMREDGYITKEQEEQSLKDLPNVKFAGRGTGFKAPHFVMYVKGLLEDKYGSSAVEQGGLKVTTSLDWALQEKAQQIVSEEIAKVEPVHITNGAAVATDPNSGEILAMVGSKDYAAQDYDGQVNVALSLRQPGSSIKPVTYVTGLKKGYTASSMIMDVPTSFPGGAGQPDYRPVSYDGKYRGPVQVRYALANSLNVPAVKMLALVGVQNMLKTAYDMGLPTLEPTKENLSRFGLSVTLGGGEVRLLDLTEAYGSFANGGIHHDPVAILKVEDTSGKVLEEYKPSDGKKVLEPGEAFIISNILSDNEARTPIFGAHSYLVIPGHDVAVKTGTTNDQRDNWTVGWTPQISVGVWVGNNDNSPMKRVASGVSGASPIWNRIIKEALSGKPNVPFAVPDDVVQADVDTISGYGAHDNFASRREWFIKGTEPTGEDPIHPMLKICKDGTGLATPSQVASNQFDGKEYFVLKEEDPTAGQSGENRWQQGIDAWLATQSDGKYHPPTGFCGSSSTPVNVDFIKPKDHDRVDSSSFEVVVSAQSTSDIAQVEIELDGVKQGTLTSSPWKMTLSGVSKGSHTLRAKAKDKDGHESDRKITIGVNANWDATP